ncbi:hypothetical protein ACFTZB_17695 [Rhodococcus sp. NPDC057014]|uniref:hypothetical protein n=1 Tax=Rhodococcus sp. NPDC057014 TaxID=3346000 RepID=UPI003627ED36
MSDRSILHRAEDLPLTAATTPVQEGDVVRRRKLIVAAGLGRDDHAGRRTVLLDPAADIPSGAAEVVRLGRRDADPE